MACSLRNSVCMLVVCGTSLAAQTAYRQEQQESAHDKTGDHFSTAAAVSFDQVVDSVVKREQFLITQMKQFHPLVETYLQNLNERTVALGAPVSDAYFLGRLDITSSDGKNRTSQHPSTARLSKLKGTINILPPDFLQMIILDEDFQRKYYDFRFIRREFLGDIRCMVFDVTPMKNAGIGRFRGRIWVEDQGFNIVRFNGTYGSQPRSNWYYHFDSWRLNVAPGAWLPAYVYFDESQLKAHVEQTLAH